jgi:hypothetical protein
MSTIVYDTLETELTQEIVIGNHLGVYSPIFKPWLYCLNNPTGTFTLGIYKDNSLVAEKSFTVSDLYTQLGAFEGIKLPFGFYILKLKSTGYTYSKSSFLAWVKDWESALSYNSDLASVEWTQYPLSVKIISLTTREV